MESVRLHAQGACGRSVKSHDRKPWALGWFALNARDEMIFFEEWPEQELSMATAPSFGTEGYKKMIEAIEGGQNSWCRPMQNVVWRIMDPNFGSTRQAATGQTLQGELSNLGMWFDCSVLNDIPSGHLAVRERMDTNRLFFTPNCQNFIHSLERYVYDEFRRGSSLNVKETPREEYKDFPDLVRYAVKSYPYYYNPCLPGLDEVTEMQNMGLG